MPDFSDLEKLSAKTGVDEFDITGKIGELYPIHTPENPPEWPMYSFSQPAYYLWNAIGERLSELGWREKRIKEWLQSKETRWALDGSLGDMIRDLGRAYADDVVAGRH